MPNEIDVARVARRIDEVIGRFGSLQDPGLVAAARDLVNCLMQLHGAGLERMMEIAAGAGQAGDAIIEQYGSDDLVGSLLALYSIHPLDLETRVRQALRAVPGGAELLEIRDGVVRVRLRSGAGHLRQEIEDALLKRAPDIAGLEFDTSVFVPLTSLTPASTGASS